ncbi:MAG: neutral/alkaline non-lysosomal ceramidase N-terminal domain-containing protein [Candidatus Latescibacter sp.]|nr:neutral/alkaline non-lysosomal ceramidase N-terminal domain-containing protein [Candidatus Latescibacter sp.]
MKNIFKNTLNPLSAIFLSMALFIAFLTSACTPPSKIKVGVGETLINPPIGTPMSGYVRTDVSKGIHDDLHARSLLVEGSDGTTVVMMTISLVEIGKEYVEKIRAGINKATGIPKENIMISATHTHSGPELFSKDTSEQYKKLVVDNSIESAVSAWENRVPGRIGIDSTMVMELGRANRRLQHGGLHPDPMVGLIKIENDKGKLLGVAFNYGCHPSTLDLHNLQFTEDWPFFAIQGIKKSVGKDVWVAYYQSAQGDIKVGYTAELSAVGAEMPIRNWWYAEVKGNQMTAAVLKALPRIKTSGDEVVKSTSGVFDYPLKESFNLTIEQAGNALKAARQKLAEMEKIKDTLGKRVLDEARVAVFLTGMEVDNAKMVAEKNRPAAMKLEQQAIRIGDAAFVSFPCEVFSEIGLKVKQQSPFTKTFVIGLANEPDVGYLPTAEEFKEDNYEVLGSPFSPKAEQVCIDSSLSLIGKLK